MGGGELVSHSRPLGAPWIGFCALAPPRATRGSSTLGARSRRRGPKRQPSRVRSAPGTHRDRCDSGAKHIAEIAEQKLRKEGQIETEEELNQRGELGGELRDTCGR